MQKKSIKIIGDYKSQWNISLDFARAADLYIYIFSAERFELIFRQSWKFRHARADQLAFRLETYNRVIMPKAAQRRRSYIVSSAPAIITSLEKSHSREGYVLHFFLM